MRDQNGRFVKGEASPYAWRQGQSGGGRRPPDNLEVRDMSREHARLALSTLAEICANQTCEPRDRSFAAVALLERGYGKPQQTIELERTPIDALSPEDTKALYQFLTGRQGDAAWLRRVEPPVVDLRAVPEATAVPRRRPDEP